MDDDQILDWANEAIPQGFAVAEGDRVEVAGVISESSEIFTGESEAYYIETIRGE